MVVRLNRMKLRLGRNDGVGPKGPTAFTAVKNRISAELSATILVVSDSTGYGPSAPIYRFAEWLAATYPTHTVRWREWAEWSGGGKVYGAPVDLSVGTGASVISIYSASLPESTMAAMTDGSRFAAAVTSLPTPDVILFDHGHNMVSNEFLPTARGDFLGPIGTIQMAFPASPMALIIQNPWRDNLPTSNYQNKVRPSLIRAAAALGNVTLIDGFTPFMTQNRAADLYDVGGNGLQHPSYAGYTLILKAITDCWRRTLTGGAFPVSAWPKRTDVRNFCPNGDFSAWPGAVPTSWAANVGCTVAKETTITHGGAAYSAAIQGTQSASSFDNFLNTANTNIARGRNLTQAVLAYVPSNGDRALLASFGATSGGGAGVNAVNTGSLQRVTDNWVWLVCSDVPVLPTQAVGTLYCRINPTFNKSAPLPVPVYVQRVLWIEGGLPKGLVL